MSNLIDKSALVAEIEKLEKALKNACEPNPFGSVEECMTDAELQALDVVKEIIDTLKVKDPYEQCIQYDSIKTGIQANAEIYSFNIESELFNQLAKEQQELWRKEIEQAYIIGGETGVELARDPRYKENLEMKEVDLEKEIKRFTMSKELYEADSVIKAVAEHFFELGLKAQKGE